MSEEPPVPAPVNVQNTDPILVDVKNDEPLRVRTEQDKVAATRISTTEKVLAGAKVDADAVRASAAIDADVLRTEDQRRISGIWERTQQIIALSVVEAALVVACVKSVQASFGPEGQTSTEAGVAFVFLASVANLVIGFYFGRTNHTRVGGVPSIHDDATGR